MDNLQLYNFNVCACVSIYKYLSAVRGLSNFEKYKITVLRFAGLLAVTYSHIYRNSRCKRTSVQCCIINAIYLLNDI